MFKKIVVGTDGTDMSERALHLACDIAQKYNSEVHLVHTPHPHLAGFAVGAISGYHVAREMPSAEENKKVSAHILNAGKEIASKYNVELKLTQTEDGDPADHIVAYAEGCGADLIVTGRNGLGRIGSLVQGSTTQRVNHLASCACLSAA